MMDSVIREFVAKQRDLLELELQASQTEESELFSSGNEDNKTKSDSKGFSHEQRVSHVLGRLEASDVSMGMYGRTVVQLTLWSQVNNSASSEEKSSTELGKGNLSSSASRLLPAHRFTVGDEVELRSKGDKGSVNAVGGVISEVSDTHVTVALFQDRQSSPKQQQQNIKQQQSKKNDLKHSEGEVDLLGMAPLTLVPKSSIEVHKKLLVALDHLERHGVDHPIAGPVIKAMFSNESDILNAPSSGTLVKQQAITPFNKNLDQSQIEAISFALHPERPVALIHGPPGTGKTTTVAELIRQAVKNYGMRVLVTAPSNTAVDNILERLVLEDEISNKGTGRTKKNLRLRTVRLGHPARIKSSILRHSLEHLVQSSEGTEIVQDVRHELQSFFKVLSNPKSRGQDKRAAYQQIKSLRKELRVREEKVVHELISSANVVLATTVGAGSGILNKFTGTSSADGSSSGGFDLVVIDEAAQALESSCWIPILRGRKVVLAGDHKQLPPTIKSQNPKVVSGLSNTMFERLMKLYESKEKQISRMLTIQYRMHHKIADWASQAMYNGELMSHDSVKDRTLDQLPAVERQSLVSSSTPRELNKDDGLSETVLLLIDTAGCHAHEMQTGAGSRFSEGEATVVDNHVRKLLALGVAQGEIAVITPYNGQVELLRNMLLPDFPRLEIKSVDGFQGGEREAVILSLVRSSERGGKDGIGFLCDDRRQNVAVTRAKRHLAVVCDTETVNRSPFISSLIDWIEEHGEQQSAIEYMSEGNSNKKQKEELRKSKADILNLVQSAYNPSSTQKTSQTTSTTVSSSKMKKVVQESSRKALMDKVAAFAESGKPGEEMVLSSELSSYDRRLVHEFAEQMCLEHQSEGRDGVERRITLAVRKQAPVPATAPFEATRVCCFSKTEEIPQNEDEDVPLMVSNFAALDVDDSDSENDPENSVQKNDREQDPDVTVTPLQLSGSNLLLAELTKERQERMEQRQQKTPPQQKSTQRKKKGQKVGGNAIESKANKAEDYMNDLDDMAFLDAQIEQAQNAHGRTVAANGKQYKTIVNGILNTRPESKRKPTNAKASASLQAKLREAETSRKKKNEKRK